MMHIKDDTFTVDKRRVIRICDGIRHRNLNFLWSCDTRADALDAEVLASMRRAGCVRLSLGVESGSPTILRNIRKKVKPEQVRRATQLGKKYGMQVRYFMMLGNRGETAKTLEESLAFVRTAAPHQAIFSCLSIYPGSNDFLVLQREGRIDTDIYFTDDFQELKVPFDASDADTQLMSDWFDHNKGIRTLHVPTVQECQDVLTRVGDLHTAHMDLASAFYRDGSYQDARQHVQRALDLGYPAPGLAFNYLACMDAAMGDYDGMTKHFERAQVDPLHAVLVGNMQAVRGWHARGSQRMDPPKLVARHDFELMELPEQPALPGPLPVGFARWEDDGTPCFNAT